MLSCFVRVALEIKDERRKQKAKDKGVVGLTTTKISSLSKQKDKKKGKTKTFATKGMKDINVLRDPSRQLFNFLVPLVLYIILSLLLLFII